MTRDVRQTYIGCLVGSVLPMTVIIEDTLVVILKSFANVKIGAYVEFSHKPEESELYDCKKDFFRN